MITLIQFIRPKHALTLSPFCLKLETFFKMAQIPYKNKYTVSTSNTQKKKLPVIMDDGVMIEDSSLIIKYLTEKYHVDLDKNLTTEQGAIGKAFQWLCEKSIVDIIVYFRWVDQKNWPLFRDVVFTGAPWFIKATVGNAMSKNIKKTLWEHGIGRFTDDEKMQILRENLTSISNYLGDKKYFFGNQPTTIDCVLFGVLSQLKDFHFVPQFKGLLLGYPNLYKYIENMTQSYWVDSASENKINSPH